MKAKAPTLKDIAKELGISISTVSRALRGMPEINLETREAVLKLSKNLEYKLPSNQQQKANTKNQIIAALIPQFDYYFSEIIRGMDDAAIDAGFTLVVNKTNESFGREVSAIHRLLQSNVDGIVVARAFETSSFEHFEGIIKRNIPLVFIDREFTELNTPNFVIDNFEGGKQAVKHLVEKGYRKICFLGAKSYSYSKYTVENGLLAGLKEAKIDNFDKKLIFGDYNQNQAFEKASEILRLNDRPDAFFAANDQVAIGIHKAIHEAGYNVPKDIGIVGYYDEPTVSAIYPALTSISVPAYEMGKSAINSIISQLHLGGTSESKTKLFEPELQARESTNQTRRFFGI